MKLPIQTREEFDEFVTNYWSENEEPKYWGVVEPYYDQDGNPIAYKVITANIENNCIVATGTCFAPGTPVYDVENEEWKKAIDFANQDNLLFWVNAKTGRFEVCKNTITGEFMNEELHKN